MNVAAHQQNEKQAGEERKQATDFKEAACCSLAVSQWAAQRKNGLCETSARGNWYA